MYVDALHFKDDGVVKVVERRNGKRILEEHPADYTFYVEDSTGKHESIFRTKVKKLTPKTSSDLAKMRAMYSHKKTYEADVNHTFRCLEQNYLGTKNPDMQVAFFDIETDFDKDTGYSQASDANNPIISIAIYLQWLDQMVCLALPPKGMEWAEAEDIAEQVGDTILYRTEKELLDTFLTLITDADVLSGWNSESYDIPYTVNRIIKVLGKSEIRRLCLWGKQPRKRYIKFGGKKVQTYDLFGRVHSDYMQLYKKYTYEEKHSYSLDNIASIELNETKVPYDGTLDQLYNDDFQKFLEYNIQDTYLLDRLDKKLQYIDLVTSIAHANSVLITTAMGTVSMMEQAITVEAHSRGMVVPSGAQDQLRYGDEDLLDDEDNSNKAAGGWVSHPKKGFHKWVGSSDLNSLYPSVIRSLNMSPETLIGQLSTAGTDKSIADFIAAKKSNKFSHWWNDRFHTLEMENFFINDPANKLELSFEDGSEAIVTGAELRKLIFESKENWCISANGTIFRTDYEGVIPSLLTRWYNERKDLQKVKGQFSTIISGDFQCPDRYKHLSVPYKKLNDNVYSFSISEMNEIFEMNDEKIASSFLSKWGLYVNNGFIIPHEDTLEVWKEAEKYWDKKQLVKKINLNSAYGGLLNSFMKFFDQRIGQSTTLTGRAITRHMTAKTNEILCNEYDENGKSIIYNDTDSVYFSAWPEIKDDVEAGKLSWEKEDAIRLYDQVSDLVSETFPQFLKDTFNIPLTQGEIIKSGREIVADTSLFIKKKRYACRVIDKDGYRKDVNQSKGSIKAMGLDLRRSDTPKFMQEFLMEVLEDVLDEHSEENVVSKIREFKIGFENRSPWEKGTPKAVNNLTQYQEKEESFLKKKLKGKAKGSLMVPGHVRASLNWNMIRDIHQDYHSGKIVDGQKIVVCYLKQNSEGMTNIAYPIDEPHLPNWFLELPFDEELMMEKTVDKKIKNLLSVLKWDLSQTTKQAAHFGTLFEF